MKRKFYLRFFICTLLVACHASLFCQEQTQKGGLLRQQQANQVQYDSQGRVIPNNNRGNDSLKRRDNTNDSITIFYRYFDSTRVRFIDSSVSNFYDRFPVPQQYIMLGNFGAAARSIIFKPLLKAGFDPGFHAYDIYRFKPEDTRFYQTTRPFTEMGYMLGSKLEQMINIIHTQNVNPDFNLAFQYRLINSPGNLQNQNSSHNNIRLNGVYQSKNKRYTAYAIFTFNKLRASENGGIQNDNDLNKNGLNDRFELATRIGGSARPIRNPFSTNINTGNLYNETSFLYRHQYDVGQKDSIILNDSTTIRLFYPRIRFQHSLHFTKHRFEFHDNSTDVNKDSNYFNFFNFRIINAPFYRDEWRDITNEFSIISFPEKKNLNQFFKVGAALQNLQGSFGNVVYNYYNISVLSEYRNRTRNQKWDLEAKGQLYLNGLNTGDYSAEISLKRLLSKKLGFLQAGFQNVNRTPSYVFRFESNYPVLTQTTLSKENTTRIYGQLENDVRNFTLAGEYFLVNNYTYFNNFFTATQYSRLFNLLHLSAEKKFRISKKWNIYTALHLQQTSGNPPVNVPLFFTNSRIAHETTPFKNLVLSYGLEFRYHSPYKADNYSPFVGQFFFQDTATISNRPDINAFFNFRIKSFKAFVRAENLNSLRNNNGIGFTKSNFSAVHYPNPAFWFRLGIVWTFVN